MRIRNIGLQQGIIYLYNNYRPIHFSELAKLQNSTLTKADGRVVRLGKNFGMAMEHHMWQL